MPCKIGRKRLRFVKDFDFLFIHLPQCHFLKQQDDEQNSDDELEYDPSMYPQRVGRQKHVLDIEFHFNDGRRGGLNRGRGGRPRVGGGGGPNSAGERGERRGPNRNRGDRQDRQENDGNERSEGDRPARPPRGERRDDDRRERRAPYVSLFYILFPFTLKHDKSEGLTV